MAESGAAYAAPPVSPATTSLRWIKKCNLDDKPITESHAKKLTDAVRRYQ